VFSVLRECIKSSLSTPIYGKVIATLHHGEYQSLFISSMLCVFHFHSVTQSIFLQKMSAVKHFSTLLLLLFIRWAEGQPRVFDVRDFHAFGDGKTDDAKVQAHLCSPSHVELLLRFLTSSLPTGVRQDMASGLQRQQPTDHDSPWRKDIPVDPNQIGRSLQVANHRTSK
jgi:hypothetical protein